MFLDFRDLNAKISLIINSGTMNGLREIGNSLSRIISTALNCQPKAINNYNKVSQGLIVDGAYQDITPDHLKAIASSVIMTAEQSVIEDLRVLDSNLSRFNSERVTTPLSLNDITKDGNIQALSDGFMIYNHELYVNPAIWHRLKSIPRGNIVGDNSNFTHFPASTIPIGRHNTSPYNMYGVISLCAEYSLLVQGTTSGVVTIPNAITRVDGTVNGDQYIGISYTSPSNIKIATQGQPGYTAIIITDLVGNELTNDDWIKVEWNGSGSSVQPQFGGTTSISKHILTVETISDDLKKSIGPVTVPIADVIRTSVGYDDFSSLPSLLHSAL